MTARRQLPTDEARDLLALTREIATKELAPRSAEAEATETFPRDVFRMLGQAGLLVAALPRGARRRRAALRGLPPGPRGDRRRVVLGRRRGLRARAVLLRPGLLRHRRAARRVAARHAERRPARRLLPLRGARRLRPRGDAYDGPPRRRLLRHQRRQGLDDARRPRRLLQGDGPHLRRPQRDLLLPRPGLRRGPERRPAGAQDGPHRLGHRDDALRQRPRRRLPPARRRG